MVFLESNVFNREDKREINGVMRELNCVINWDKILELGSEFKLFELPTVASA